MKLGRSQKSAREVAEAGIRAAELVVADPPDEASRAALWVAAGVVLGGAYWLNPMLGLIASVVVAAAVGGAAQSAHETRMREWNRRHRFGG